MAGHIYYQADSFDIKRSNYLEKYMLSTVPGKHILKDKCSEGSSDTLSMRPGSCLQAGRGSRGSMVHVNKYILTSCLENGEYQVRFTSKRAAFNIQVNAIRATIFLNSAGEKHYLPVTSRWTHLIRRLSVLY